MHSSKKVKLALSSLLSVGLLFSCFGSQSVISVNVKEKERHKAELKNKAEILRKELLATQKNISEESKNKEDLDRQIEEVKNKIDQSNNYINELNNKILDIEQHIKEIEADIERKMELLKDALVLMYKAGDATTIDIVLGSKDFSDFLEKSDIVRSVSSTVEEIINALNDKQAELEEEKNKISVMRAEQEAENEKLEKSKLELQELIDKSEKLISEYKESEEKAKEEIVSYDKEIQAVDDIIKKYYEEEKRKEEERRKKQGGKPQKPSSDSGNWANQGAFVWPVPGFTRISSDFYDSAGRSRMHGAIDIARTNGKSIYGASVVASGAGKVVKAGVIGGYGNSILIDHGNGIMTRYSHLSSIGVSTGQVVSRGQSIGNVGSTGHSTGPHLDFEVIVNGVRQNPLNYVKPS